MGGISSLIALAVTARNAREDLAIFQRALESPLKVQRDLLFKQIRREQETAFGRDHGFREIQTLADFRRQVPIGDYASHAPYVDRVWRGDTSALFSGDRVVMFALSSGTTQARKTIPVTERVLERARRMWTVWGLLVYSQHPNAFRHGRLAFVADWEEMRSPSGLPCGAISGMLAHIQDPIVRLSYVLPPEAGKVEESDAKFYLAWRLGLKRTIGTCVAPNPSTLLSLACYGTEHADGLIRDLFDGRLSKDVPIPESLCAQLGEQLRPQRLLARMLTRLAMKTGGLRPRDVWPELKLLGCWTGGTVSACLKAFPDYFGSAAVRDIGLMASEGRMTMPVEDGTSSGVLEIVSGFFEFIPVDEVDSLQPTVLESHELKTGEDYYILLTNPSGLYRYNIRDVVRCTGWLGQTPLLAFLNKGTGVSDIAGEKLTEHQVVSAVTDVQRELNVTLQTFSLAPCWNERMPFYGLFLETSHLTHGETRQKLTEVLETALQRQSLGYAKMQEWGRLGPLQVIPLPDGFWSRWDQQRQRQRGSPIEQYKHPFLITNLDFAAEHGSGNGRTEHSVSGATAGGTNTAE